MPPSDPVGPASRRSLLFALLIVTALSGVFFLAIIAIGPAGIGLLGSIASVFAAGLLVEPLLKLFRIPPLRKRQDMVIGGWCGILGATFFMYSVFLGFFAKMSSH